MKDKIYVYNLLVPNENYPIWKEQSIKHTASMNNLYTDIEQNMEYDRIERILSEKYESPVKIPLEKACQDEELNRGDWEILIDFVLLQLLRTPTFYMWIVEFGRKNGKRELAAIDSTLSQLKEPPDLSEIKKDSFLKMPFNIEKIKENQNEGTIEYKIEIIIGKKRMAIQYRHFLKRKICDPNQFSKFEMEHFDCM